MNFSHAQYLSLKRFESLDGLRAISILAVIWHHTVPAGVNTILAHVGAQGVSLFFAISGFLITTLLLRERARNGRIDIKAFYLRRSLRIFPLYFGTLILYIAVVSLLERHSAAGQAFYDNLIYFATYTSNLFVPLDGRVIFYFVWSLAAEEQFYLIWPPVLIQTVTGQRASIVLLVALFACILGQLLGNPFLSAVPLPIVIGALLAISLNHAKGYQCLYRVLGAAWSAPVIVICLILTLIVPWVPGFIASILFAAFVGLCSIQVKHPLASLFSLKPVVYIGSISYGMYMLHMLCKSLAVKLMGTAAMPAAGWGLFPMTLLLTVLVAGLSFKYYEAWFLGLKTRFER